MTATVIGKSPNLWYSTVTIDKGESSGVRINDPVVNGEGLVGKVAEASSDGAEVDLITDTRSGVSARIGCDARDGHDPAEGGRTERPRCCNTCLRKRDERGENVVTSGTVEPPDNSLYPPGIPIGQVNR